MLGKQADVLFDTVTALIGQVQSGSLKALAVTGKNRFPAHFCPMDPTRSRRVIGLLSMSMRLNSGESVWITFQEARLLFSRMDQDYAFGEMDEAGKLNLTKFAARREQRSSYSFMPMEGRVYFTRM